MQLSRKFADLSGFPIARRWPPQFPDRVQYYGAPSPNGVKVSIMLEETGIPYEGHRIDLGADDQHTSEYRSLNPYGKIPAIIDPCGPDGSPVGIWESGAILVYLAEKSGRFLSPGGPRRYETMQWLMWQMAAVGPMFGQIGYFHKFSGRAIEDKRPLQRYAEESQKLLRLLEARLEGRQWIIGNDYSIADIAMIGWVDCLINFYDAAALVDYKALKRVPAWLDAAMARPAVQRGMVVCARQTK